MESRITLRSNPGILIFGFIIIVLFAVGVLLTVFVNLVLGIIVTGIVIYLFYYIYKYLRGLLQSRIITDDESIRFILPYNEELIFSWKEITHAGLFEDKKGKEILFLYREPDDKLMSVHRGFSSFDSIKKFIMGKTNFMKLVQENGETLEERLKMIIET